MAAAGAPRLIFQFIVDTGDFQTGTTIVNQSLDQIQQNAQNTSNALAVVTNSFNNMNIKVGGFGQTTRASSAEWMNYMNGVIRFGGIARQVIGMYTSWTVWQIRTIQYENQLREARQRHERLMRQVVRTTDDGVQVTRQLLSLYRELIDVQLGAMTGWDGVRRATGNLVIAIGRYGAMSEEARDATFEWTSTLMKWAEQARRAGVSTTVINRAVNQLQVSISRGQIPTWEDFQQQIGVTTEAFPMFASASMDAYRLAQTGAEATANMIDNILPVVEDVRKAQEDWSQQIEDSTRDMVAALQKLRDSQNQNRLMAIAMGIEVAGLVFQVAQLIIKLAAESAAHIGATGAITGHNIALGIMHALSGPAGWAILAVAAAIAIGTTAWILHTQALTDATRAQEELNAMREQMPETEPGEAPGVTPYVTGPGGLPVSGRIPGREVGGVIPETRPYMMTAGEVVTPAPLAATGRLISPAMKAAAAPQTIENNYNFGDVVIQVQTLQREEDLRQTAIRLRRYIEVETARTR